MTPEGAREAAARGDLVVYTWTERKLRFSTMGHFRPTPYPDAYGEDRLQFVPLRARDSRGHGDAEGRWHPREAEWVQFRLATAEEILLL